MKKSLFLISLIWPVLSFSIVDTRSAGYSKNFVDFTSKDVTYPLEIKRTYNSRSIYNGLFGFGWCSNFETRLSVLPDGMIKVVECGGGMEIFYQPKGKTPDVNFYVNTIMEKLKKRKVKMSKKSLAKLKNDLLKSQHLRANFLSALDIKGQASKGMKYYARGRAKEYIVFTAKGYTRHLPNDVKEVFDKEGRLVETGKREGKIEITWKEDWIQMMNDKGHRLNLSLKDGKVKQVTYNKKVVASYTHKNDNLVKATNSNKESYEHSYDSLHNLTKNVYPDKTTEELTYNVKKDWVISL